MKLRITAMRIVRHEDLIARYENPLENPCPIKEGDTLVTCEYCGATQTLPSSQDEHLKGLFVRANGLRLKNAFDKAAGLYEAILQEDSTQAEAYWGLLLCEYGIEYVVDPGTERRVPTCHRLSYTPIPESENYAEAMRYADGRTKVVYQQDAEALEMLRKAVAAKAKQAQPVDIFICYKESEEGDFSRRRTLDSELAGTPGAGPLGVPGAGLPRQPGRCHVGEERMESLLGPYGR